MTKTQTAGQQLAATLCRIKQVGGRTRTTRDGINLKNDMLDSLRNEFNFPGYYEGETQAALRPAMPVLHAWEKHVLGFRIDGVLAYRLSALTPYQFAAYLGRMVDAGITNNGEAEVFFRNESHAVAA